ncbi:MAG: GNAT family N-acetyltransferase [Phycisphaerales bacterium]|nr:MAG: GNAT family N-acetyltransferase [Phycisphaerales bacterium]
MLEGKNVVLRLLKEEDLEEFVRLYNDASHRGEYYPISLRSLSQSRKEFQENGWWDEHQGRMLITDKEGLILGCIFFFKGAQYQEGYEIGYFVLRRENRGRGIISEALPLFSAYLFELKPIERLYLLTAGDNIPSQKVARKAGYQHEGTLRKAFFLRGKHHDCEVFSLLREECPSLKEIMKGEGRREKDEGRRMKVEGRR